LRIDIFLRLTGVFKTRSIAGKACRGGSVFMNGQKVRPSSTVIPTDSIRIILPSGTESCYEVLAVPESGQVSRKEREMYIRSISRCE